MYAAMALERVKNEATWLGYKFQKKEYSEYQEKLIQEENAVKEAEKAAKKEAKEAEKAAKKAEKEAKKAEKLAAKEAKDTEPRFFTKAFNIREFLRRKPNEEEDDIEEFVEDVETFKKIKINLTPIIDLIIKSQFNLRYNIDRGLLLINLFVEIDRRVQDESN